MRIALDFSGVDPQTGVRIYTQQLLGELQKLDRENLYYVIMRRADQSIYELFSPNFQPLLMPAVAEPTLMNMLWHWSGFQSFLKRAGIEVLHQMDCNRISPIRGPAQIVTVHGLIDNRVPGRRHFFRQQYNSFIVPRLLDLATQVISVSNNTRNDLLEFTSLRDEIIHVIPEGCALEDDPDLTMPVAAAMLKKRYGIEGDFILYVARLEHPNKNHVSLLEAYRMLLDRGEEIPPLVLVGGDSYRADVVRDTVRTLNLSQRVRLAGFVPDDDISAFYKCASLYVCPTFYEGFGLPVLEAMQFGVPVVCSDASSLPEVVGRAAVKIDPRSVASISEGILSTLSDHALRQNLIQEGYRQVALFSSTEMAKKTLEVYRKAYSGTSNAHCT